MASRAEDPGQTARHYDVIVVGAGMAGLRMVIELRKLGMSFLILEEGGEVGGTW
jgi:cyclohexanone monooxygenase